MKYLVTYEEQDYDYSSVTNLVVFDTRAQAETAVETLKGLEEEGKKLKRKIERMRSDSPEAYQKRDEREAVLRVELGKKIMLALGVKGEASEEMQYLLPTDSYCGQYEIYEVPSK